MAINLCENNKDGHHKVYLDELSKIENTKKKYYEYKLENNIKCIFRYFYSRYTLLKKFLNNYGDIHLLYLDALYILPILKNLNKSNKKVIGTLHFVPNKKIKMLLLKNFSKKINFIVVHSENLKNILEKNGIKNVKVVEYPSFYDYSNIESKQNLKKINGINGKIILTALGGTRDDKGLDILLESFKYINEELKDKIVLNIAGKEESFKKEFIRRKAKDFKINIREQYGFLTDKEFMENVILTDIMIMPYRKNFGGNSGPMTEAIVNKIPIITPREINIGKITEEHELGLTFECENSKDLARVIEEMTLSKRKFLITNFYKQLTLKNFLKNYKEIYDSF